MGEEGAFQRASYSPGSLSPVKKSTRTGGWANNASRAPIPSLIPFKPISSTTKTAPASSSLLPPETIYDLFAIIDEPSDHSPRSAFSIVPADTNTCTYNESTPHPIVDALQIDAKNEQPSNPKSVTDSATKRKARVMTNVSAKGKAKGEAKRNAKGGLRRGRRR